MNMIKCNKCQHEWSTKSDRLFVTCPNCLCKVKQINEGIING